MEGKRKGIQLSRRDAAFDLLSFGLFLVWFGFPALDV